MYLLNVLDKYGTRKQTINGVAASGPARGVRNVTYDAYGTKVSQIGQITFEAPTNIVKNNLLQIGNIIQLYDMFLGIEGSYVITERSLDSAAGGWMKFTCPDLMEELRWLIYPGYVNNPNEDVPDTMNRITSWASETAWTHNTTVTGYKGVSFIADKISLAQMTDKLAQERFALWTTGPGRVVNFFTGGQKSGIRLAHPSRVPNLMTKSNIRPITSINEVEGLTSLVNCITPNGAGNGFAELTLAPLYNYVGERAVNIDAKQTWYVSGPSTWAGKNPAYPIYRRFRIDGLGPKQEFFICDPSSIQTYRQRWLPYSQTQITPISGSPADMISAAASLYQTALAYLFWHMVPNQVFKITTDGRNGSNIGVGGKTVHIDWQNVTGANENWTIHKDLFVLGVNRSLDPRTGAKVDTWDVATTPRAPQKTSGMITGMLQDINYWKNTPMIYPGRLLFQYTDYLDDSHPMSFVIPGDAGIIERVSAKLTYKLIPIRSTATTATGGSHTHTIPIPATSVPVSGVTTPVTAAAHGHPGTTTSTSTSVSSADANNSSLQNAMNIHRHHIFIQPGGNPGTGDDSNLLYWNPSGQSGINYITMSGQNRLATTTDNLNTTLDSTHGHGASSASSTGVTPGGALNIGAPTPGQTAATQATTTTSLGGTHTHPLAYGIYSGPKCTSITISVDSTIVVYNATSDGVVDIIAQINDQQDHTVTVTAVGLGGCTLYLSERHRETTYVQG